MAEFFNYLDSSWYAVPLIIGMIIIIIEMGLCLKKY